MVYLRDALRFYRYSSALRVKKSQGNLRALIAIDHHRVEKGMSLPKPRFPFGLKIVERLLNLIDSYQSQYGVDWICVDACLSLDSYFERHKSCVEVESLHLRFREIREGILSGDEASEKRATGTLLKPDLRSAIDLNYREFLETRHSIRDFAPGEVSRELISEAVQLAIRAPSVCNRQPWKVFEVRDSAKITKLFQIQGGARGFSDQVSSLLVTTVDLTEFHSVGERAEAWVDGGIFLGYLLLALHSVGLGACPLNWCVATKVDRTAREILPEITPSRIIIALTAVGHLHEETRFARSERRPLNEVLAVID